MRVTGWGSVKDTRRVNVKVIGRVGVRVTGRV